MPGVELWLPGAGHTRDNVVVWLKQRRVLFGGCFLKSVTSPDLGNITDAVVPAWAGSVTRARQRYSEARIVVPGHGTINGDPISATLMLLQRDASSRGAAK